MRIKVEQYAQKTGSKSARTLANALGVKRLRRETKVRDGDDLVIVNWGFTNQRFHRATYINHPSAVARAASKVETFRHWREQSVPSLQSTECMEEARVWASLGYKVYCRTLTRANSGRGIVVAHTADEVVKAGVYTRGIEIDKEYRVHVAFGEVIRVQAKRRRKGHEYTSENYEVRNSANGWVFCQENVTVSDAGQAAAVAAVESLGLDFGAVDLAECEDGSVYAIECNTAPGLEGTTIVQYQRAFHGRLGTPYPRDDASGDAGDREATS